MKTTRMRGVILAGLISVLIGLPAMTQADVFPEWITRYGVGSALTAGIQGMVVDAAGVSYVTGTGGPSGNTDVKTAAFAPDGSMIWSHSYNGPQDWHDQGRGIALGPGGVIYVTGNTPGPGLYSNVLLLKYDGATGALLNAVQYSSHPFTAEYGASVVTDAEGNVYVAGGTGGDGTDALILKFDANGVFQWRRQWDGPAFAPYSLDQAREILVDPFGYPVVMIHGVMNSLHPDYVVIKYAPADGATVWETNWGVNGGDFPEDMEIDSGGDVFVTGTGINFTDQFSTIRLRGSDGALLWQAYDHAGQDDYAAAVHLDERGGVYVTGSADPDGDQSNSNDNIYTVKRDAADGSLIWTHLYGANCIGCFDSPADVVVDAGGNVFVAGTTNSPPYSWDMILLLLDSDTGLETDRGIVSGAPDEIAGPGILAFDAAYDLFNGGEIGNFNTGSVDITVVKYASLVMNLYQMAVANLVAGSDATFSISNATPSETQYIYYSLRGPGSTPVPELGVTLDLANARLLVSGPADGSGSFETTVFVPNRAAGRTIWFQTAEMGQTTPPTSGIVQ